MAAVVTSIRSLQEKFSKTEYTIKIRPSKSWINIIKQKICLRNSEISTVKGTFEDQVCFWLNQFRALKNRGKFASVCQKCATFCPRPNFSPKLNIDVFIFMRDLNEDFLSTIVFQIFLDVFFHQKIVKCKSLTPTLAGCLYEKVYSKLDWIFFRYYLKFHFYTFLWDQNF